MQYEWCMKFFLCHIRWLLILLPKLLTVITTFKLRKDKNGALSISDSSFFFFFFGNLRLYCDVASAVDSDDTCGTTPGPPSLRREHRPGQLTATLPGYLCPVAAPLRTNLPRRQRISPLIRPKTAD